MNLQLNDEQKLLHDSAQRWVAAQSAGPATGSGQDERRPRWATMGGFGWLAMTLPEAHAGLGQTLAEACLLTETFDAGPLAEPYLPAIVQAAEVISKGASEAQCARWLPPIATGEILVVPADLERPAPATPAALRTRAARQGTQWRLDGHKSIVPSGDIADAWLVSAREEGGRILYFIVPRGTAGTRATPIETVEYTRTRQQFGKPLSLNQVLRHRMADMSVASDEARSITIGAIQQLAQADAADDGLGHALAACAARAKVAAAARKVAEEAIQLHGGMGVTEELNMGRYLRRLLALDALYGGAEKALRRTSACAGIARSTSVAGSHPPGRRRTAAPAGRSLSAGSSRPNARWLARHPCRHWGCAWRVQSSCVSEHPSRRAITCRGSCRATTTGVRGIPSPVPARIWPRSAPGRAAITTST